MIELVEGSIKGAVKEAGGSSGDLWKIPPGALRILKGFNVRVENDAYKARVKHLKALIAENGYRVEYPLVGFAAHEDGELVVYVTGGHRRHRAVMELIAEGHPKAPEYVPVVIPKGRSMADLTAELHSGNDNDPLSLYETALVCKQLTGLMLDSAQIATRLNFTSAQYVDGLLLLAAAPLAVARAVSEGVVSGTVAIEALRKHGNKAQDVLLAAIVKAGGKKVTASTITPEAVFKKLVKRQAQPIYQALVEVEADPAYAKLSAKTREQIAEIFKALKK